MLQWPDVGVMTTLLLLNGSISFYETQKAGNAIAQLKKNLAAQAKVYRDGNLVLLDAAELVPGDRIFLKVL